MEHVVVSTKPVAQGDLLVIPVDTVPSEFKAVAPQNGGYVLAHSETGHHHFMADDGGVAVLEAPDNPLHGALVIEHPATIEHQRPWDTHAPLVLNPGKYLLRRQREAEIEGFRRVAD